jgi:intracellular sulfur oxidation DsrE/DsrF family protein
MLGCKNLLWLFLSCAAPIVFGAENYAPQKVVYHINYSDISRIGATFGNINNHIEAVGEDHIDLKVMIHGAALEYFIAAKTDSTKQIALDSLRLQDVQFLICNNTLQGYHLGLEDLYDVAEEDMVQAGLPAMVALQQAGYIYLRP